MRAAAFFLALLFLLAWTNACGCGDDDPSASSGQPSDDDTADDGADDDTAEDGASGDDDRPVRYPTCTVDGEKIDALLASMTLREKIAQMYVVGVQIVPGVNFGDAERFVRELGVGGVFLQAVTGIGPMTGWTVANTNKLQLWAMSREHPIPLMIACDQEGGIPQAVNALTGGTDQPGNMALGASFDPAVTRASYSRMGRELAALGLNNPYSPVLGLTFGPNVPSAYTRSFGRHGDLVALHAREAVRGFQQHLVMATAKHFPGHTAVEGDEHAGLPTAPWEEDFIRENFFPAYRSTIDAGVAVIMTTHAAYDAWGGGPTTFNRLLIEDVLRGELGFRGVVLTDDINMGAIMLTPWTEPPDVLAIRAGADMVLDVAADADPLFGIHPDNQQWPHDVAGQIDRVVAAVQNGELEAARIDVAVRRILETKMRFCLFDRPFADTDTAVKVVGTSEAELESLELHARGITMVRDQNHLLPFEASDRIYVTSAGWYQSEMYPDAFWANATGKTLVKAIEEQSVNAYGDTFRLHPGARERKKIVDRARDADRIVIGTYHAYYDDKQAQLVRDLLALNLPTVIVALATPYDLLAFPEAPAYLAAYSNRNLAVTAVAEILFGLRNPAGRLPVDLPGLYPAGWSSAR